MRKTTEYKAENRLTVDIEGLMAMLSCGEVTAKKIADYAEARVIIGRRVLYNVDKIKNILMQWQCNERWEDKIQQLSFGMKSKKGKNSCKIGK